MSQFPDPNAHQPQPASPPPPPEAYAMPPVPPAAEYASAPPLATMAPTGMYFDSASGLTLPEGVQLASAGRRIGAYFLAIPLFIVTLGIGYIVWGLIAWAGGQTPALQVLGMRCWRPETRSVPGFWWMALREIVGRLVDGILGLITQLVSFILFLTRQDRQSLHDLVAGTVVLHDPNKVLANRASEASSSFAASA